MDLSFRFTVIWGWIAGGISDFLSVGLCETELVSALSEMKSVTRWIAEFIWSSVDSAAVKKESLEFI